MAGTDEVHFTDSTLASGRARAGHLIQLRGDASTLEVALRLCRGTQNALVLEAQGIGNMCMLTAFIPAQAWEQFRFDLQAVLDAEAAP